MDIFTLGQFTELCPNGYAVFKYVTLQIKFPLQNAKQARTYLGFTDPFQTGKLPIQGSEELLLPSLQSLLRDSSYYLILSEV